MGHHTGPSLLVLVRSGTDLGDGWLQMTFPTQVPLYVAEDLPGAELVPISGRASSPSRDAPISSLAGEVEVPILVSSASFLDLGLSRPFSGPGRVRGIVLNGFGH